MNWIQNQIKTENLVLFYPSRVKFVVLSWLNFKLLNTSISKVEEKYWNHSSWQELYFPMDHMPLKCLNALLSKCHVCSKCVPSLLAAVLTECLTCTHWAPVQGKSLWRLHTAYERGSKIKLLNALTHRYRLKILLLSLLWMYFLIFFKLYLRICFKTQMPTKEHFMRSTGPGLWMGSQCHMIS